MRLKWSKMCMVGEHIFFVLLTDDTDDTDAHRWKIDKQLYEVWNGAKRVWFGSIFFFVLLTDDTDAHRWKIDKHLNEVWNGAKRVWFGSIFFFVLLTDDT